MNNTVNKSKLGTQFYYCFSYYVMISTLSGGEFLSSYSASRQQFFRVDSSNQKNGFLSFYESILFQYFNPFCYLYPVIAKKWVENYEITVFRFSKLRHFCSLTLVTLPPYTDTTHQCSLF
jgi:hypothetical protein